MTDAIQAPFTPTATVVEHIDWQVNDPLVHYMASDLNWPGAIRDDRTLMDLTNPKNNSSNPGQLNHCYMPWGGNPTLPGVDKNSFNLSLKDPLVWRSDNWDFPTNEPLSSAWLRRIHRGTPWQTIYLKSSDILQQMQTNGAATNCVGTNVWMTWTGDTNVSDALAMAPVQDRHLASLLAYLMNTKPLPSLYSVNKPNMAAWSRVLHGLTALTNILSDSQLTTGVTPQFDPLMIRPHSPQAEVIETAIESAKASQPDGRFHDVGDILEVPQLSDQSPFLNWNDSIQQRLGISDEAYEILPGELLPLLRADSIGSVSSANGRFVPRFSAYDDHTYAIEVSSNLVNWVRISTNVPRSGSFSFTNAAPSGAGLQFYRSVLVQ